MPDWNGVNLIKIKTENLSFLVMKLYLVTLEKVKRSGHRKAQFIELQKLAKESIRPMHRQQFQEHKKNQLELFTYNMDTYAYVEILMKNIKVLKKIGSKKLILVWDNAPTHVRNKAKEFYLKNRIERIEWPAKISRIKSNKEYLGIVKNELDN